MNSFYIFTSSYFILDKNLEKTHVFRVNKKSENIVSIDLEILISIVFEISEKFVINWSYGRSLLM